MSKRRIFIDASDGIDEEELSEAARVLQGGEQPSPIQPLGTSPAPAAADAGEGVSDGSDLMDGQWAQFEWQGLPGVRCAICEWDTLEGLEAARAHRQRCPRCAPPPEPVRVATIPVADRWGNVVTPTPPTLPHHGEE